MCEIQKKFKETHIHVQDTYQNIIRVCTEI